MRIIALNKTIERCYWTQGFVEICLGMIFCKVWEIYFYNRKENLEEQEKDDEDRAIRLSEWTLE